MQKVKKYAPKVLYVILLVIFIAVMVFPFYWLVLTSFKDPRDISLMPTELWPSRFSLKFFSYAFTEHHLEVYLLNSVIVALGAMGLTILFAFPAAYAFSRIRFKFKKFWRNVILLANMFPIIAVVTPMFIIFRKMHLINTYWGLIVPSVIITLPMAIWTLQAFIDTLPKDLEEAAQIDGCSRFQAVIRIIFPLAAPAKKSSFVRPSGKRPNEVISRWSEKSSTLGGTSRV